MRWLREHRKDLLPMIEPVLADETDRTKGAEAFRLLLSIGFEAGRHFQVENPEASMMPDAYIP